MSINYKDYWYVFFTKTGKEELAEKEIKFLGGEKEIIPFNFSVELFFKKKGELRKEIKQVFPGYLFVTSRMKDEEFLLYTREFVKKSNSIIKILRYGNSEKAAIRYEEKVVLASLLQNNEYIKVSKGYIRSGNIIITEGPLIGKEESIKSINRHKRQAIIELPILDEMKKMVVGIEIIEKNSE